MKITRIDIAYILTIDLGRPYLLSLYEHQEFF